MTLVVSTSSPLASAALFDVDDQLVREGSMMAPRAASGKAAEVARKVLQGERPARIAVDVGPGGFTSVRAALAMGKALAWAWGIPLGALSSFDLVSSSLSVAIPAKKGTWWLRAVDAQPVLVTDPAGAVGYRLPTGEDRFPHARAAAQLLASVEWMDPAAVMPVYLADPSISVPKGGSFPAASGQSQA